MDITLRPIGTIHSPFKHADEIQPGRHRTPEGFDPIQGKLEVFSGFAPGLDAIEGFSHIIVLFAFHMSGEGKLTAHPPFETEEKGVFATRSPHRPNPLGMTVLRLLERRGNVLEVGGIDMIEGTPILDIKPYTPRDLKPHASFGWLGSAGPADQIP
jgi:tRNA-Thr(GGU) m(6)t(6)A37 methyltransferase TsaA